MDFSLLRRTTLGRRKEEMHVKMSFFWPKNHVRNYYRLSSRALCEWCRQHSTRARIRTRVHSCSIGAEPVPISLGILLKWLRNLNSALSRFLAHSRENRFWRVSEQNKDK